MSNIRVGVMGCASIARRMVIPALVTHPKYDLVAVASRSQLSANEYAELFECDAVFGYDNLLVRDDIDVVYMPLPTGLHLEWVARALQAGKHILVEKSFAVNLGDAKYLVKLAKSKGLLIKENYMFEHHEQQNKVKEIISSELGEVRLFRAFFGFPPLESSNFRYNKKLGGGALLDAGGYVLKAPEVFFPNTELNIKSASLLYDAQEVDIGGAVSIEIAGQQGLIPGQVSFGFDHFYQCGIEVWGSKGRLVTNRTFTAGPDFMPTATLYSGEGIETIDLCRDNHFIKILSNFYKSLNDRNFDKDYKSIIRQASMQQKVFEMAKR